MRDFSVLCLTYSALLAIEFFSRRPFYLSRGISLNINFCFCFIPYFSRRFLADLLSGRLLLCRNSAVTLLLISLSNFLFFQLFLHTIVQCTQTIRLVVVLNTQYFVSKFQVTKFVCRRGENLVGLERTPGFAGHNE